MKHSSKTQRQAFHSQMSQAKRVKIGKRKSLSLKAHHWRIYRFFQVFDFFYLLFWFF